MRRYKMKAVLLYAPGLDITMRFDHSLLAASEPLCCSLLRPKNCATPTCNKVVVQKGFPPRHYNYKFRYGHWHQHYGCLKNFCHRCYVAGSCFAMKYAALPANVA